MHSVYVIKNVNDLLASTNYGTEANYLTVDSKGTISQKDEIVNSSDEKNSNEAEIQASYTPDDEQELTRMAREGEITAEEYGRRMLEIKESRSEEDLYSIARMSPEDMNTTPTLNNDISCYI